MISEKNFAGNSSYIFYSLALTDGLPTLNIQLIQKSKGFLKANCFDKNSKLFYNFLMTIVTLLHIDQETVEPAQQKRNVINWPTFFFVTVG
jgi:hypothetical protein